MTLTKIKFVRIAMRMNLQYQLTLSVSNVLSNQTLVSLFNVLTCDARLLQAPLANQLTNICTCHCFIKCSNNYQKTATYPFKHIQISITEHNLGYKSMLQKKNKI